MSFLQLDLVARGVIDKLGLTGQKEIDFEGIDFQEAVRLKVAFLDDSTRGSLAAQARGKSIQSLDHTIADGKYVLEKLATEAVVDRIRELLK